MLKTKKRANSAQEREERESLLSGSSSTVKEPIPVPTPPSSGNAGGFLNLRSSSEKRRTVAKAHPDDVERVSLLGNSGSNAGPLRPPKNAFRIASAKRRERQAALNPPWTMSRLMKYLSLMLVSCSVTFWLLHKQSKEVHWDEYRGILEPDETKEKRCFEQNPGTRDTRCTCPDPKSPLQNTTSPLWGSHHQNMVFIAEHAPKDLDVVFFGDDMIEQLSGTRALGVEGAEGMEEYFEKTFTRKGGGKLNAIALGSSGDTGPNLLWHWENGIKQANLKPKVWFIMVGGNDLFQSQCTDRFVQANILNVLKRIYENQPEAQFIVHGIIPRKDNPDSPSNALGHLWDRAQGINLLLKKFAKRSVGVTYLNAGQKFTTGRGDKGRGSLDPSMIKNGNVPTLKGMTEWGKTVESKIREVMHGFDKSRLKKKDQQVGRIKQQGNKKADEETRKLYVDPLT
ncbi:GDSL-like lipase/acylhydrolase family protein [Nitzschia inconspicua]|uniref:GDSL-like lipase/acylhydrolase family protein n=1 Tax=Nitzschia inconspicua TaxID=303405 RepID=A0A9K3QAB4_9STRA|nr:GDSL-like lipase/acylhydrolase family protein [Nitzschia inconspicua]